jgi:hypothetical protein
VGYDHLDLDVAGLAPFGSAEAALAHRPQPRLVITGLQALKLGHLNDVSVFAWELLSEANLADLAAPALCPQPRRPRP